MAKNVNAAAVGLGLFGIVFLYSGVKGKSISGSIQALLNGQSPATADSTNAIVAASDPNNDTVSGVPATQADSATTAGQNQILGKSLAAPYGWDSGDNWDDLVLLWNRESGWSNLADNKSSGAYGIAQALPSTKYPLQGQPVSQGGSSDAATQIQWGLTYIHDRYGSPVAAWQHEQANSWY